MLVLLFLAPLFKYTPLVALSSIIVVAMIGLIKVKEFCHLYRVDKFDFCICMVAFIGVIFFTMVIGLSASVCFASFIPPATALTLLARKWGVVDVVRSSCVPVRVRAGGLVSGQGTAACGET
jgi:MFS superfamily sulfate permease-like transporter